MLEGVGPTCSEWKENMCWAKREEGKIRHGGFDRGGETGSGE